MSTYIATGQVIDRDTSVGMAGLLVEAWDSNVQRSQFVFGKAKTDTNGRFSISFDLRQFDLKEAPDLFFKVFRDDKLLESTESSVLWNANTQESVTIRVRQGRERAQGKDRVTSAQVFSGVEFLQKSDFKGVFREQKEKAGNTFNFVKDMFKNSFSKMDFKPVKVKGSRQNEVINQDVAVARQNLASKNIAVKEVLPYKPGLNSQSVKDIAVIPRDLKPGQEIRLYEENGKVRYYSVVKATPIATTGDVTKHLEAHTTELNRLQEELKANRDTTARKDEQINSLQQELEGLRKDHADNNRKKDEQINSLQKELEVLRKDHSEINTVLKSESFGKLLREFQKKDRPGDTKGTTRNPRKPK